MKKLCKVFILLLIALLLASCSSNKESDVVESAVQQPKNIELVMGLYNRYDDLLLQYTTSGLSNDPNQDVEAEREQLTIEMQKVGNALKEALKNYSCDEIPYHPILEKQYKKWRGCPSN